MSIKLEICQNMYVRIGVDAAEGRFAARTKNLSMGKVRIYVVWTRIWRMDFLRCGQSTDLGGLD